MWPTVKGKDSRCQLWDKPAWKSQSKQTLSVLNEPKGNMLTMKDRKCQQRKRKYNLKKIEILELQIRYLK